MASIFGSSYLDTSAFKATAATFGAVDALAGLTDPQIDDLLAASSRAVEAYCNGMVFTGGPFTERHKWNEVTRRIHVNNPPVLAVTSYIMWTGPSTFSTFTPSSLFINNDENYVELAALSLATSLTSYILTLGLFEPVVEITYTTPNTAYPNVPLAVAYEAAERANDAYGETILPSTLTSLKSADVEARRSPKFDPAASDPLRMRSVQAMQLLPAGIYKTVTVG